jgi:hypothetical protein
MPFPDVARLPLFGPAVELTYLCRTSDVSIPNNPSLGFSKSARFLRHAIPYSRQRNQIKEISQWRFLVLPSEVVSTLLFRMS